MTDLDKIDENKPVMTEHYTDSFYQWQMEGSYKSASIFIPYLFKSFKPQTVADIGCGRGAWLKACLENGVKKATGFDGSWNNQENMIDQTIQFTGIDLNFPITEPEEKFDLAISLEVAEHIEPTSADIFIKSLTSMSDVIMFSAAYTKQGGNNHINEQPHTYWAKKFISHDFVPYDIFRPVFWGNSNVELWYQQNTFLYVKKESLVNDRLLQSGHYPLKNIEFMNCLHSDIFLPRLLQPESKPVHRKKFLKRVGHAISSFSRKRE